MHGIGNTAVCFLTLWLFLVMLAPVFDDGVHAQVQAPTVSDDDRLLQRLWLEAYRELLIHWASTLSEEELLEVQLHLEVQSQPGALSQKELSKVVALRNQLRTVEAVPTFWSQKNYRDLYDYLLAMRRDDIFGTAVRTVAQISLGIIYAHQDVPQWLRNITEARRWFFRAAQAGSSLAQYRLALMLKSMNSHDEALQWAKRARNTLEKDGLGVKPKKGRRG